MEQDKRPKPKKIDPETVTRLRAAVDSKKMKMKQFAREANIAYPSLREYYGGMRKPGFDALTALIRFTGVSGTWLVLGEGEMFPAKEPPVNVDEGLMGHIAQIVAFGFHRSPRESGEGRVREEDRRELYSISQTELKNELNLVGERTAIAASIYNRVASIQDNEEREKAIEREVQRLVRLNRGISATKIQELQPGPGIQSGNANES